MKRLLVIPLLMLTLAGCDRHDKPKTPPASQDVDNTSINTRDRNSSTKTPLDQSESEADRTITQSIRRAIMSDGSLSNNAKNIKIITIDGVVTLRGPVSSSREKEDIAKKATSVQGVTDLDNQLEIIRS